jgi:ABC-2 type transport system ATP-binding protein
LLVQMQGLDCVISLVRQDDSHLRIHASGEDALDRILDALRQNGGRIRSLSTVEPTLEDVFLHLTGREMRDEATGNIPSPQQRRLRRAGSKMRR